MEARGGDRACWTRWSSGACNRRRRRRRAAERACGSSFRCEAEMKLWNRQECSKISFMGSIKRFILKNVSSSCDRFWNTADQEHLCFDIRSSNPVRNTAFRKQKIKWNFDEEKVTIMTILIFSTVIFSWLRSQSIRWMESKNRERNTKSWSINWQRNRSQDGCSWRISSPKRSKKSSCPPYRYLTIIFDFPYLTSWNLFNLYTSAREAEEMNDVFKSPPQTSHLKLEMLLERAAVLFWE